MDDALKPASQGGIRAGRKVDGPEESPADKRAENPAAGLSSPPPKAAPTDSTGHRSSGDIARDRWFTGRDDAPRIARRLNIVNEAQVVARGPLRLTGNITLVDEQGATSFHNELTLCRCGASGSKPLCDDQHIEVEFFDRGDIVEASSTMSSRAPQPLRLTCVKNGPLKFRGYLRVFNARGQECISRSGALCRCGKSTKKPFCDCL